MRHHKATLRHIVDKNDNRAKAGFVEVYKSAFSEAPYFETFEDDYVINSVWLPHLPHCVVLVEIRNNVVGLGCAHPIISTVNEGVKNLVLEQKDLDFDVNKTIYMSELAVLNDYRKIGIGTKIIKFRLKWARENGYSHYCMRTAASASNSISLYEAMGAKRCEFEQDMSDDLIQTSSNKRVYLYGDL